jgi:protoporphyrinogen oxidase
VTGLRFRATVLVYLVLNKPRLTPHDTHFFPAAEVPFSRISEPRNFSGVSGPPGHTGLCAELPCDLNDATWHANDAILTARVVAGLRQVGLPVDGALRGSFVRRVPFVYPVYSVGVEGRLQHVTDFLDAQPGLVNLGRQGLFLHDNTHHTMALAYSAADCLTMQGHFDTTAWQQCRQQAAEDVVED